jgi:hypothetical protein
MAQTQPINVVTTAVPFLRISPDARSGAIGDAGIALSPDANSTFWNLAKTPFAKENTAASATYSPWLKDIAQDVYLATLAGYHKLDDDQAISASLRYFNLGDIQFVDNNGNQLNTGRPREFAFDFGYSRKVSRTLGVGVTLRYINSSLANGQSFNGVSYKAGTAFAGDLSVFHDGTNEEGKGLRWGVTLANLGSKIGYTDNAQTKDFIPAYLGLGAGYTWVFEETSKFTLTANIDKLMVPAPPSDSASEAKYYNYGVFESWFKSFGNKAFSISGGGEYSYNDQFFARAGYYYETKEAGDRKYFTAGVGLKYNVFGFDFSYLAPSGSGVTRNPLSNTLRFSILFNFGAADNAAPTSDQ